MKPSRSPSSTLINHRHRRFAREDGEKELRRRLVDTGRGDYGKAPTPWSALRARQAAYGRYDRVASDVVQAPPSVVVGREALFHSNRPNAASSKQRTSESQPTQPMA